MSDSTTTDEDIPLASIKLKIKKNIKKKLKGQTIGKKEQQGENYSTESQTLLEKSTHANDRDVISDLLEDMVGKVVSLTNGGSERKGLLVHQMDYEGAISKTDPSNHSVSTKQYATERVSSESDEPIDDSDNDPDYMLPKRKKRCKKET